MVFTSNEFLLFFALCAGAYFLLPHRFRWILLLVASYAFYAAGEAEHLPLLIAVTLVAYGAGRLLEATRDGQSRRVLFVLAVAALLTPLFLYKYLSFFLESASGAFVSDGEKPASLGFDLLLPLGISFFTFQALGYVIDIYRRDVPAERHVGTFSLYVAFFPQLIAGPIERAKRLLPQLRAPASLDPDNISVGSQLILWGVFKKLVIADNLAPYVDTVYAQPTAYTGLPLLIATVFFAFQIYCDFSGYVDIARGTARILGIRLMLNFDRPYGARSIGEFWHRWHISLSTWFRDYLYIPLGGSRCGTLLTARNVAVVFLLSGLWHGANWTFVVWGGLHGAALIVVLLTRDLRGRLAAATGFDRRPRVYDALCIATTLAFVGFAWIFFRAMSLDDAFYVGSHLFTGLAAQLADAGAVARLADDAGGSLFGMTTLAAVIVAMFIWHVLPADTAERLAAARPPWQRWATYYMMAFGVLFWAAADTDAFIYFRF